MPLFLGEEVPDFTAQSTHGEIQFYSFIDENSWAVIFSHPQDFTPVCTTELSELVKLVPEFEDRQIKIICLSCDPLNEHQIWAKDIVHTAGKQGDRLPFPIIADPEGRLAKDMGILDEIETNRRGDLLPCRAVIVIGPGRLVKLLQLYPVTTGRNFEEILRVVDSLKLAEYKNVVTPANWKVGDDCIVNHKWTTDEASERFPNHRVCALPSKMSYLRYVDYESAVKLNNGMQQGNETQRKTTSQKPYRTRSHF